MNKRILIFPLAALGALGGFLIVSAQIDSGSMPGDKAGATALTLLLVLFAPLVLALLAGGAMRSEDKRDIAKGGEIARAARARRDADADRGDGWILILVIGLSCFAVLYILATHAGR